jgi:hypothetical protein
MLDPVKVKDKITEFERKQIVEMLNRRRCTSNHVSEIVPSLFTERQTSRYMTYSHVHRMFHNISF